jgi:hypothetical protein
MVYNGKWSELLMVAFDRAQSKMTTEINDPLASRNGYLNMKRI